jgi:hypothetical protein
MLEGACHLPYKPKYKETPCSSNEKIRAEKKMFDKIEYII